MPGKFVVGAKAKLSIKILDAAFIAAYDPANPVPPAGPFIPLVGGTAANESITSNNLSSTVFGDDAGFEDGIIAGSAWSLDYSANALQSDPGYLALDEAGLDAVTLYCWIRKQDPPPPGGTAGRIIEGVVSVADWSHETASDSIVTCSATLTGRGRPIVTPAA